MKSFDYSKKIAEHLQSYKKLKAAEKEYTPAAIKKRVVSSLPESEQEIYNSTLDKIKEATESVSEERKQCEESIKAVKQLINDELEKNCEEDARDVKEETLTFTGIGSVTYTRKANYSLEFTEEQKKEIINELIKRGDYDFLDINQEKIVEFSKEIKEKTGSHITGIREFYTYETKIK